MCLISCAKNTSQVNDEFVQVNIPETFQYKSSQNSLTSKTETLDTESEVIDIKLIDENGQEVIGKIRFTMPSDDSISLVNLEVTNNLVEEGGLSSSFFEDYYLSESGKSTTSKSSQLGCFNACKKIKKGEGRGVCKAECWFNILAKAIPIIIAIL